MDCSCAPHIHGYCKRQNCMLESDKDGNPWRPTDNSRVCSVHFVGGKKSDDKNSPSYIPSILPAIYSSLKPEAVEQDDPELRHQAETHEIGCRTRLNQPEHGIHILFGSDNENDPLTQTKIYIPRIKPKPRPAFEIKEQGRRTIDKGSSPEFPLNPGFTGFAGIKTETAMRLLAGVSREFFSLLSSLIIPSSIGQPAFSVELQKENRLLLFLMKMKLGISFRALGCLFHISASSASKIFHKILKALTVATKTWIFRPSRESLKANLPKSFYHYPTCKCTIEIFTDTPPTVEQRVLMYSNYKSNFTVKFFIFITPDGSVRKVSKGYGGRATDSYVTNKSRSLNLIEPGDSVLADKEFPQIKSELSKQSSTLVIPPFAFDPQFAQSEVDETDKMASVRIHVKRALQRIKLLRILNHFDVELLPYTDAIMHMCCIIANSQLPLIRDE